ncbi:Tectonin beta-propeller repeat-containing protein 2 [Amphibalanus amphitrite]|uniref:Tectonin beta-propeller repeat-containing protein 2 n=1 Tax=Amphibalanus amphitrite TaxID=1232801 RepID=A0A6A4WAR2_AMPAM|nr:Tectonin beta-propeller repeat-containing protein 2 [Amphibalanus amphitrite]
MTDAVETAAAVEEEDPSSPPPEEDPSLPPPLKEWAPLNHLMLQVPAKYQNLLVTGDLQLTSVSAVDEHILLGTNTGSVYWYDTVGCTMQRYRAEGQQSAVCRVSAVTSVDHLLAAGHRSGDISVFLVPRLARGDVPDYVRITESNIKKSLQFRVDAGHRVPISALAWSRNAARLFSGDREGTVAVSEIDYVTETVCCRVVVREPTPVVQLQYSRQTLLVASRGRCCLLSWPDPAGAEPQPRQVGTKPRKSPADLGACFLESDGGEMTVLAARPSLKVVTADLTGQVSATISLKPTLETAGSVPLLFPVAAPTSEPSPGRLAPLWPGAVALYDNRTLLVVDVVRWEIVWRCDHLPAILDLTVSGDAVFVLCSARRLIRLSQTPDNHPAVCDNMRVANGDLSFDEVMQELKSSVPVNQVKTLLSSVHGQLGRSGLLDAFTSQKVASGGSSGTPSPPTEELRGDLSTPEGQTRLSSWMGGGPLYGEASQTPETQQKPEPETEPEPEPSYLSLFPLNKKRSSSPPPPRHPIADSETGEPLRHVVERLDYSACQVAVSWDGRRVWRLDANGAAYSLADPEPGRPTGTQWVRAASDVLQLAADATAVWYIKRGGRLYVQRDLSAHRCASSELSVDTPGPIIHVTARDGVVWAVTDKGNVLWRVGVSRAQLAGYSWEPLTLESLKARAVFLTAGELGWLVDDRGRLHVTSGVSASLPRGMDSVWRRVLAERSSSWISGQQVAVMSPGAALRPSLAVEGAVAWLADPGVMSVMTCRHHIIAVRWEQFVPRGPRQEWSEIHADGLYQRRGQLWALSGRGQLYGGHGHDGDLQLVPLPERNCSVACVSAAPGALWLLTAAGAVYVREGMEQTATGNDWVQLDLVQMDGCRLVHLSVGAQSVWACDAAGRVLVRLGPTVARRSAASLQPAWVSIDRPAGVRFVMVFASCMWEEPDDSPPDSPDSVADDSDPELEAATVCVGPADQQVWALDSAGVPWRRCGLDDQPVVGTQWRPAGGVSADRLAVSPAGVWARCRRSGRVHRWMETAAQWCRVPGITRHASVSVSGELWVVHRGALYTLHDLTLRPGRPIEPRVTARSPPPASATAAEEGDDRDWELVTY